MSDSTSARNVPLQRGDPRLCPQCERVSLRAMHCKLVCDGCGYVESCEDNFLPNQRNPDESGETGAAAREG